MQEFVFTPGQQTAYDNIAAFVMDPQQTVMVLRGYAGTGKSTLVKRVLRDIPNFIHMAQLLDPHVKLLDKIELTATTNKAAEALSSITNKPVRTIQSLLGLMVKTDFQTGESSLSLKSNAEPVENKIIVIDEASMIDPILMRFVFSQTKNCKILFIGDPAQILAVKCAYAPAFESGFTTTELTEVVRQAGGNPIIDLATAFRNTVNNGEFFSFEPDGKHIIHMNHYDFSDALLSEFTRPDWKFADSKVLAWTNKTVIAYNKDIREHVQGDPALQVGDYALNNRHFAVKGGSLKTDQMVQITAMEPHTSHGLEGHLFTIDYVYGAFMPNCRDSWKALIKRYRDEGNLKGVRQIEDGWIDLRAAYACTINKSQGSTYDKVFIDLSDVAKCNQGNLIARMLYVAVSRARHQVILTGDFV